MKTIPVRASFLKKLACAALCTAFAGPACADFLPSPAHAGLLGPWLNPFVPGWSPPAVAVPPAPPPGVFVGAPVGGPFMNDILGPLTVDGKAGFDAVASPGAWHWEIEIDLDPYGGLGPAVPVIFAVIGGPAVGPVLVPLGVGPDIYIDVHQPDDVEVGGFAKFLINLTPVPVGWGTSVVEDPGLILGDEIFKEFCVGISTTQPLQCGEIREPIVRSINALALLPTTVGGQFGFVIEQRIPLPGTAALLALGMLGLAGLRAGRRDRL